MDKESFVINCLQNRFIGDDGAVVGEWVYSKDIFAEGVHFKFSFMNLEQIARKAMLVNLSDAIAMNAKPKYALIGITIPKYFKHNELKTLTQAFLKVCQEYGVILIGGDTTSGSSLVISVTVISHTKKPVFRNGLKNGDLLAYTGKIGDSLKGLKTLLRGGRLGKNHKFITPNLKGEFFYKIAPSVNCALDLSDGLGKDLSRLSKINRLGFKFFKPIKKEILSSGEEYEMLFSFSPKYKKRVENIAKKYRVRLNIFAKAIKGAYKNPCKEHHF